MVTGIRFAIVYVVLALAPGEAIPTCAHNCWRLSGHRQHVMTGSSIATAAFGTFVYKLFTVGSIVFGRT